eukprot:CAMPEP_0172010284 /NCGR_PEP_ID=MMETSP1041-20130122/7652_1 /TAXON_ID=464988 /ORGANISM="Hemiselmis andersenii, Strain CCMP439" /LENGTH=551 /DNA_ID=CAMNT_0012664643 /DNA_START=95 /DNA_END=1747 /DNA_ORIENTATION=+
MFWRLGFAQTSPLEQLLESEDFTLQQVLEENEVIQECKQLNKKLIDFLAAPEQVKALIDYVVDEPPEDGGDKEKFIYPYKASEVLSSDLNAVYDTLFANEEVVNKFFTFLSSAESPLNPIRAGYFTKVVSTLLSRRPDKGLVPQLLLHISTYSALELLLKVVSEVEEAASLQEADFGWLYDIDLVSVLLGKLDKSLDSEVQANASVALVGFVSQSPMQWEGSAIASMPSRFVNDLMKAESVSVLLQHTLSGTDSSLEHGLTVLSALVKHCTGEARTAAEVAPVMGEVRGRMGDLVNVLRNPPKLDSVVNQAGPLDPPLGSSRIKVLEVFEGLLKMKNRECEDKMREMGAMPVVMDLFFKYEWHTFLHNLVQRLIEDMLQGGNEDLKRSLFTDGELLDRIISAHARNDEWVKEPKRSRLGYMGQLRNIANTIMAHSKQDGNEWMSEYISQPAWGHFLESELDPTNERYEKLQLGSVHNRPNTHQQEEDDDFTSPPATINPYDHFNFRAPDDDQEDLFDGDEGPDEYGDEKDYDDDEGEGGLLGTLMGGLKVD